MYWEMATCDHFDRQKEFLYLLVATVTHLEVWGKKLFSGDWLQRSKSKINKKYDNAPNYGI